MTWTIWNDSYCYSGGDEVERLKRRKRCNTCKYRGFNENGCDYIYITGHRRGSSVEECSRYEKGKRIKAKMVKLKIRRENESDY